MVHCRSATVPNSLVVDSSCCRQREQSKRMCWAVCSSFLQSNCTEFKMTVHFRCTHRLQCRVLKHEYGDLLMSSHVVDWSDREFVVSSGASPLGASTVVEQGFDSLSSGDGQNLRLFAPRLGQIICSSLPGIPQSAGIHRRTSAFLREKLKVFQQLVAWLDCFWVCKDESLLWF